MVYRLAVETGLRASELGSLTPHSFRLTDLDGAMVSVEAAYSKHRRDDTLPLRRELAEKLKLFLGGRPGEAPLFAMPQKPAEMLRRDLTAARDKWLEDAKSEREREKREKSEFLKDKDAAECNVDFHALRHTFITRLARSGVAPAVAKSLARHSTITLTMDHYTHTLVEDERDALDRLPSIGGNVPTRKVAQATGTYDATGADAAQRAAHLQRAEFPGDQQPATPVTTDGDTDCGVSLPAGECKRMQKRRLGITEQHSATPAAAEISGGPCWTRTSDRRIMSPLL